MHHRYHAYKNFYRWRYHHCTYLLTIETIFVAPTICQRSMKMIPPTTGSSPKQTSNTQYVSTHCNNIIFIIISVKLKRNLLQVKSAWNGFLHCNGTKAATMTPKFFSSMMDRPPTIPVSGGKKATYGSSFTASGEFWMIRQFPRDPAKPIHDEQDKLMRQAARRIHNFSSIDLSDFHSDFTSLFSQKTSLNW